DEKYCIAASGHRRAFIKGPAALIDKIWPPALEARGGSESAALVDVGTEPAKGRPSAGKHDVSILHVIGFVDFQPQRPREPAGRDFCVNFLAPFRSPEHAF